MFERNVARDNNIAAVGNFAMLWAHISQSRSTDDGVAATRGVLHDEVISVPTLLERRSK